MFAEVAAAVMPMPLPLSLVLITRDAAHELAACLASASFADEIVVVDSGSGDDTVAVARGAGARVVEHACKALARRRTLRWERRATTGCCASMPTSA